jgi:hypothetical protein
MCRRLEGRKATPPRNLDTMLGCSAATWLPIVKIGRRCESAAHGNMHVHQWYTRWWPYTLLFLFVYALLHQWWSTSNIEPHA